MTPQPEQIDIPGTETPKIVALDRKAKRLLDLKGDQKELKEKADYALAELLAEMAANNIDVYRLRDGTICRVTDKKSVKFEDKPKYKTSEYKDED